MPVSWIKNVPLSLNKEEGGNEDYLDEDEYKRFEVSYEFKATAGTRWVCIPKIDYLRVTLFDPKVKKHLKGLKSLIIGAIEDDEDLRIKDTDSYWVKSLNYKVKAEMPLCGGSRTAYLVADPYSGKSAGKYLQLVFNPSKLGHQGLSELSENFTAITSIETEKLVNEGRIARFDVAIDLVHASPRDLIVRPNNSQNKTAVFFDPKGKPETIYYDVKGNFTLSEKYLYDSKAKKIGKGRNAWKAGPNLTRLEIRYNSKKLKFENLAKQKNRLTDFSVIDRYAIQPPIDEPFWELLCDVCSYGGMERVMSLLPKQTDVVAKEALDAGTFIWRPEELWKSWPTVVNRFLQSFHPAGNYLSQPKFGNNDF